jgi:hypothetical protein
LGKSTRVNIQKEFHDVVKALAADTVDLFDDDQRKRICKALAKGNYTDVAEQVLASCMLQPRFDNNAIVDAFERGPHGLEVLGYDAVHIDKVISLSAAWTDIQTAMMVLPSLTWPKGIKFGA